MHRRTIKKDIELVLYYYALVLSQNDIFLLNSSNVIAQNLNIYTYKLVTNCIQTQDTINVRQGN